MTQKQILEQVLAELNSIKKDMPNGELVQLQKDVSSLTESFSDIKYTLLNPEDGVIVKTNQNTDFRRSMQAGEREYRDRVLETIRNTFRRKKKARHKSKVGRR